MPAGLFPGKKSVHCDALFPYSFIQTQNSAITRSFDVSQFHEIIHVQSDSDMAAVSMVGQGIGVTILPSLVFTGRQKGVHSLRLEPALYRTLGLSYPHGLPSDSAAMKFVGYIRSLYENGYFGAMKERIF